MQHAADFRRCLMELDVSGVKLLWAQVAPHLPQPTTDFETLAMLHRARTEAKSIPFRLRAFSHRWMMDHALPSGLPDALKPRADREYPVLSEGVGISVNFSSLYLKPVEKIIENAMSTAVLDRMADGVKDPAIIKSGMMEAREKTMDKLFGKFGNIAELKKQ